MSLKDTHALASKAHTLAGKAHEAAQIALTKQDAHEDICGERYRNIIIVGTATQNAIAAHNETLIAHQKDTAKEFKSARNWLIGVAGFIIIGLLGVLYEGVKNGILFNNLTS
tara:strand:+ start:368 stop:703 length:336 start_codon:yes stop_codon:yes gene_type:complete